MDLDGLWGPKWLKSAGRLAWKHRKAIALTATMFVPGLGAVGLAGRVGVWAFRSKSLGATSVRFGNSFGTKAKGLVGREGGGTWNRRGGTHNLGWGVRPTPNGPIASFRFKSPLIPKRFNNGHLHFLRGPSIPLG